LKRQGKRVVMNFLLSERVGKRKVEWKRGKKTGKQSSASEAEFTRKKIEGSSGDQPSAEVK